MMRAAAADGRCYGPASGRLYRASAATVGDVTVALMCYAAAAAAVADLMPMLMLIRHRSVQVCSLTNTGN